MSCYRHLLPLSSLLVASITPVHAAPDDEIIVSAFREIPLRQADASVTLLSEQTLRETTVQHFEELVPLIPNMNYSGEGSRAKFFQLRGIGELEQYQGAPNPSVGFLIDDIDLSGIGGVATLYDVNQVEVLRGPQGTRFGANALAGLVYVETANPSEETQAGTEVTFGNDDTWAVGGHLGGQLPGLNDAVTGRVSVQKYGSNGFRDNRFYNTDDTYERDELSTHGKLDWQVSDAWEVRLTGLYVDVDNGYDAFAIDNGFETFSDKPGQDAQETTAGALRITGDLGDVAQLVSITTAANSDSVFSFDADWGNDDFWSPFLYDYFSRQDRERDTVSQEFRLVSGEDGALFNNRAAWVIGAYYQGLDEDLDQVDRGQDDFTPPFEALFDSDYEADTWALFAQTDIDITERMRLSAGVRYEHWEADYTDSYGADFDPDDDLWGGDLSLSYDWSDQWRGFARVAAGFKAGGFNLNANVPAGEVEYDSERLWDFELGLRARDDEGRWNADLTLFWMERDDMQVKIPVQDVAGNPILFSFFTDNAETGRNYGAELSGTYALTDEWQLHGAFGLLETEVEEFNYDPALEGRDQAHAPSYTFSVGASWANAEGWLARADINGTDEFYFDYGHDQKSDSYELVNLKFGRTGEHWSVMGWVRNVFDEDYAVRGFFFGNEPPLFEDKLYKRLGDPRHYGVTISYNY